MKKLLFLLLAAATVTACDADISFSCLSGAVYNATHYRYFDILFAVSEFIFNLVCNLHKVNPCSSASRTRNKLNSVFLNVKSLENIMSGIYFLYRIGCE